MTPRENFFAMMYGHRPERMPFEISLTPPVADELERRRGTRDPVSGLGADFVMLNPDFHEDAERWRQAYRELGVTLPRDHDILRCGITFGYPEKRGDAYHLAEILHTLAQVDDVSTLEQLPWPDPSDPRHYDGIAGRIREIQSRGLVAMLQQACTVFEDSWYLRGMENVFADLVDDGGVSVWLLDYFTERSVAVVSAYVRAGVDMIWLGDDIGMQHSMIMSPDFWREHLKPRLARVIAAIRSNETRKIWVAYHSDGSIEPVIPDLFEMGIDILNPVQPECMDVRTILTRYREAGAFWGMIGTQSTMPNGTPEDVRRAVRLCAELARQGSRLICAPTHVIEPDVRWENIDALVEAVRVPL